MPNEKESDKETEKLFEDILREEISKKFDSLSEKIKAIEKRLEEQKPSIKADNDEKKEPEDKTLADDFRELLSEKFDSKALDGMSLSELRLIPRILKALKPKVDLSDKIFNKKEDSNVSKNYIDDLLKPVIL